MFEGWSDRKRITLAKATTEKVLDHLINLLFPHENNAPETESIPTIVELIDHRLALRYRPPWRAANPENA